eukprot:jgi/Mesvir1/1249/Mv03638-RA.1
MVSITPDTAASFIVMVLEYGTLKTSAHIPRYSSSEVASATETAPATITVAIDATDVPRETNGQTPSQDADRYRLRDVPVFKEIKTDDLTASLERVHPPCC